MPKASEEASQNPVAGSDLMGRGIPFVKAQATQHGTSHEYLHITPSLDRSPARTTTRCRLVL